MRFTFLDRIEQSTQTNSWWYWLALALFGLALSFSALQVGISMFSTDSWTYLELTKAIFSGDFYRTNTIRSYVSTTYSASHPFGFPILVALIHEIVGAHPTAAVWANILLALGTGAVTFQLSRALNLSSVAGALVASSIVFYDHYLGEVLGGRAMPLALFAFFCGWYFLIRGRVFIAGAFLGLAALARFDFLVYALLFQAIWFLQPTTRLSRSMLVFVAFALTLSPWIYYSVSHFGVMWASDNSWIVASAVTAYVVDYPAVPTITAVENPVLWIQKLAGNVPALAREAIRAALASPGLLVLLAAASLNPIRVIRGAEVIIFHGLAALCIAFVPYLATGYFDNRYFTLSIAVGTLFLVWRMEAVQRFSVAIFNRFSLLSIALLANVVVGASDLATTTRLARDKTSALETEAQAIDRIAQCHADAPEELLIFARSLGPFPAKYGALTGMRAALIPSNFDTLDEATKARYFEAMKPFVLIESLSQPLLDVPCYANHATEDSKRTPEDRTKS